MPVSLAMEEGDNYNTATANAFVMMSEDGELCPLRCLSKPLVLVGQPTYSTACKRLSRIWKGDGGGGDKEGEEIGVTCIFGEGAVAAICPVWPTHCLDQYVDLLVLWVWLSQWVWALFVLWASCRVTISTVTASSVTECVNICRGIL